MLTKKATEIFEILVKGSIKISKITKYEWNNRTDCGYIWIIFENFVWNKEFFVSVFYNSKKSYQDNWKLTEIIEIGLNIYKIYSNIILKYWNVKFIIGFFL